VSELYIIAAYFENRAKYTTQEHTLWDKRRSFLVLWQVVHMAYHGNTKLNKWPFVIFKLRLINS